jgi:hypothetical protein
MGDQLKVEVENLRDLYHNLVETSNEIKRQIQKIRLKHRIDNLAIE